MLKRSTASFLIGLFARLCAVFVPRMGGLFAGDPDHVVVFPMTFVLLGMCYAAIVGLIVVIIYFDKAGTPSDRFMTGLGAPALHAGASATSAHTAEVQKLQATT